MTEKEKKPYEKFHNVLSKDEYYKLWDKETLDELIEEDKIYIYDKYKAKCLVLQRDDFTCQNRQKITVNGVVELHSCPYCKNLKYFPKLTFHHIKFRKNNGVDKARNGVTLCSRSHNKFHKAEIELVFDNTTNLPPHIRGHTFKLSKSNKIDWKTVKKDMKDLRREIKSRLDDSVKKLPVGHRVWFRLKEEQILILLKWLYVPYDEFGDD